MNVEELVDGVFWLSRCYEMDGKHMHLSQYLVRSNDGNVVVDAGEGHDIVGTIQSVTDGEDVDALLLTHSILPHTKEVSEFRDEWNDLEIVSASRSPGLVGLPNDSRAKIVNTTEVIGGQTFTFVDPLITDIVLTTWIYHHESGVLFTAEGVGNYHSPGQCALTSTDGDVVEFEHVHEFHRDKFPYLTYVDPEKLRAAFEAVFDRFDVEFVAPVHGNPIAGADVDRYLDRVIRSVDTLSGIPHRA